MKDTPLATECYANILQIAESQQTLHRKYAMLHQVFVEVLNEHTRYSSLSFSGPYARFDYLCRTIDYPDVAVRRVNAFRNRTMKAVETDEQILVAKWPCDLKAVAEFAAALYKVPLPGRLKTLLPAVFPKEDYQGLESDCVRVVVREVMADSHIFLAEPIDSDARCIRVCFSDPDSIAGDYAYLDQLMKPGDRLNLIRPVLRDGVHFPQLIVYLPDLLFDVTAVASCFQAYGNQPLHYLLEMLSPKTTNVHTLLGIFAGQMLDEEVHHTDDDVSYLSSVKAFFRHNATKLAVCEGINSQFHEWAEGQQHIIRDMVRKKFLEIPDYDPADVLIEPSFCSEMLGLKGRMDLMQENMRVLVEQKSGKRNTFTNGHQENHYVQVLLYRAVLHYNYGMPNNKIDSYLLYSKYPDGLLKEGSAPALLFEAMRMRNQMAWLQVALAQGAGEELFMSMTPETLNLKGLTGKFWEDWVLPPMRKALEPMHNADLLTRKYVFRLLSFVAHECLLSRIGTAEEVAKGAAAMWNATTEEKLSAGNILHQLTIRQLSEKEEGEGTAIIVFEVDADELTSLPNFRVGDMVAVYHYEMGTDPHATTTLLFKAYIIKMEPDAVTVRLRDPQKNTRIFKKENKLVRWAIEHDTSDSSYDALYRSVTTMFRANADRRELLLGLRRPKIDRNQMPVGEYGAFQHMVERFVRTQDYMLLIGPPGTGKTSIGLVYILKEQLCREQGPVLLLSYTNRAVNEICSKLVEHNLDFVRIGSSSSCPEEYQDYMIEEKAAKCDTVVQVRQMMATTRIFVSTTTSILLNVGLFEYLKFSLAIVDEASQILDPHLLGILCARHGKENAIRRFVLIGDQKQLPAVVQQNESVSRVDEEILRKVDITNCRHSLFERLIRLNSNDPQTASSSPEASSPEIAASDVIFMLKKQGRMHPEVADFPNKAFYHGQLDIVPLPHQNAPLSLDYAPTDNLASLLATHRMVFMAVTPSSPSIPELPEQPSSTSSSSTLELPENAVQLSSTSSLLGDKINPHEAKTIAHVIKTIYDLYLLNGKPFSPENSLGVIVPYRHQIACVMENLKHYGIPQLLDITIDTVERYQGSQRDVIVYGFTIRRRRQLDFLLGNIYYDGDTPVDRKLNVALTRAREQMIVVGNPQLLSQDPTFSRLIAFIKSKGGYCET